MEKTGMIGAGEFGTINHWRTALISNIPLGKGHGDRDFAGIVHYILNPLAQGYHPDMILVSCGFDLYMHDPLGGMTVTPEGYALITFFLLDIAQKVCNGRIAFVMEGGYSLKGIRECGLRVMQELCDVPTLNKKQIEKVTGNSARKLSAVRKVIEIQKEYWKILR